METIIELTCKKCGDTKPVSEFVKNPKTKYGYIYTCKVCRTKYTNDYYTKNKERLSEHSKDYWAKNREWLLEKGKEYRAKNKGRISKRNKEYKAKNKDHIILKNAEWYKKNYDIIYAKRRIAINGDRDKYLTYMRGYYAKNIDDRLAHTRSQRDELHDQYVCKVLYNVFGISTAMAKEHPELIESYREQIRIRRLLKSKKDENTKTS